MRWYSTRVEWGYFVHNSEQVRQRGRPIVPAISDHQLGQGRWAQRALHQSRYRLAGVVAANNQRCCDTWPGDGLEGQVRGVLGHDVEIRPGPPNQPLLKGRDE